jgi:hypothetical protein
MRRRVILTLAAIGACIATHAISATELLNFTVSGVPGTPSGWFTYGAYAPFGLSDNPIITGSVTIDTSRSGSAAFVDLNYTTGSKTWTVSDIAPASQVYYTSPSTYFSIYFKLGLVDSPGFPADGPGFSYNTISSNDSAGLYHPSPGYSNNTAGLNDVSGGFVGNGGMGCYGCVIAVWRS